jgi:hypothetical protein
VARLRDPRPELRTLRQFVPLRDRHLGKVIRQQPRRQQPGCAPTHDHCVRTPALLSREGSCCHVCASLGQGKRLRTWLASPPGCAPAAPAARSSLIRAPTAMGGGQGDTGRL